MATVKEGDILSFYAINSTNFIGEGQVVSTTRVMDPSILSNASNVLNVMNAPPYLKVEGEEEGEVKGSGENLSVLVFFFSSSSIYF